MNRLMLRIAHIHLSIVLIFVVMVFCSCSGDNPAEPVNLPENTMVIGPDGGSFNMADQVHLYIPAGAVSAPTTFALEEVFSPPEPPAGCIQVGPAFTASSVGTPGSGPLALAMEFDYIFTGELTGKTVFLSRWDDAAGWQALELQGGYFPLGLGVTVWELGTFAAHIDTTSGESENVFLSIVLSSKISFGAAGEEPVWKTTILADFLNSDQSTRLWDTGGPVHVGGFQLGADNHYTSNQHEVLPGSTHHVVVPGSEIIPTLDDSLHYFDSDLILNNPPLHRETINPLEPYLVTWEGSGPQLVWLTIYGDGADGSFSFHGKMTPNTGEFVFTPEVLSTFAPGTEVVVFLQRVQARSLSHPGFHHSSYTLVECGSSMKVAIQ